MTVHTGRKIITFLAIVIVIYFSFYYQILKPSWTFWGSDAVSKHYPVREYLRVSMIRDLKFPFWSEKVFLGYPMYADTEHAYLNIINILFILIFGSMWSIKILHFITYLAGALSFFYIFNTNKHRLLSSVSAVLIYYFNFFHINHLIHWDIVITTMLIPLNILLAKSFIEKKSKKYILFQAVLLSYEIYWGHPHALFFVFLSLALYVMVVGTLNFSVKFKYLLFAFLLALSFSLPQLIPAYKVFRTSDRLNTLTSTQGSLTPEMSLSFIFPYIFSTWGYYYGDEANHHYSYTEFYIYIGISTLTLFFIYLLCSEKDKDFYYAYILFWIFLLLSYIKFVPLLNSESFPIISMFRYWPRSVILLSLGISLVMGKFYDQIQNELKLKKENLKFVVFPIIYLASIHLFYSSSEYVHQAHTALLNLKFDTLLKKDILLWLLLPALCFFSLVLSKVKNKNFILVFLVIFIFIDLRYFGTDPLKARILKWTADAGLYIPIETYKLRMLEEKADYLIGMKPLLYEAYTPYGYSQFVDKTYMDFFKENNLGEDPKNGIPSEVVRETLDTASLSNYGFVYINTKNSLVPIRDVFLLDITRVPIQAKLLKREEGHVVFETEFSTPQELELTTKYDQNWVVKVNGQKVPIKKWGDLFLSFEVPKGLVKVELYYVPYDLLLGLLACVACSSFLILLLNNQRVFSEKEV